MSSIPRSTWRPLQPEAARHDCQLCGGTGWRLEVAAGQSLARRCECRLLCRSVRLKEEIQVPARYEHCTLDGYRPRTVSQHRALRVAQRFVERYPHVPGGVFLAGPTGVGKTHLAVGILLALAARYREKLLFVDFGAMLEAEACRRAPSRGAAERRVLHAELLVIDDFGDAPAAPTSLEYVEWVLQSRWNSRRLTILTGGFPALRNCETTHKGQFPPENATDESECETGNLRQSKLSMQSSRVPPRQDSRSASSTRRLFVQALSGPIRTRLFCDNRLVLVTGSDYRTQEDRPDGTLLDRGRVSKVA